MFSPRNGTVVAKYRQWGLKRLFDFDLLVLNLLYAFNCCTTR